MNRPSIHQQLRLAFRASGFSEWELSRRANVKNLTFIPDVEVNRVLLVDDLETYVHPEQKAQWIPIHWFEPPLVQYDAEFDRVMEELVRRVSGRTRRSANDSS